MSPYPMTEFWLKAVGALLALLALFLTWRTHTERATFEMIDRLYSLCHTLENHLLKEWRLGHLFCMKPQEYIVTKASVEKSYKPEERLELLMKEKLFAIHVFIIYEQIYYQWSHSSVFFHRRRKKFLSEMLKYFTDRFLRNPRLLALLKSDPTGVTLHLEGKSIEFFLSSLPNDDSLALDPTGPFGGAEAVGIVANIAEKYRFGKIEESA